MAGSTVAEMEQPEPKRAAVYVRVSTAKQAEEGLSLDAQTERCRAKVKQSGWKLAEEHVYVERGVSGGRDSRPQFNRLLVDADRGAFDFLVIPKLDRLGRSAKTLLNTHARLREAGVGLISVDDGIDATSATGDAQLGMLSVFAQFEAAMIGERVRDVQEGRRAKGLHNGRAPYGYRKGKGDDKGRLFIEDAEAAIVHRIFEEWNGGISQYAIAQRLNQDPVRPRQAAEWSQGNISQMLRRALYAGLGRDGEEPCRCGHVGVITGDEWERAQSLLGGRHGRGGPNRRTASGHLFLNGFLRCGICGSKMGPRTDKRHGYETYWCYGSRNRGAGACSMPMLHREPLERAVVERLRRDHVDVKKMVEDHAAAVTRTIEELEARRKAAERADLAAEARILRVTEDYQDEKLRADEWREQKQGLEESRRGARAEARQLADQATRQREAERGGDAETEVLRFLADLEGAVLGPDRDAEQIERIRAGVRRLWSHITVRRVDEQGLRDAEARDLADLSDDQREMALKWEREMISPEDRRARLRRYKVEQDEEAGTERVVMEDDWGVWNEEEARRLGAEGAVYALFPQPLKLDSERHSVAIPLPANSYHQSLTT